MINQPLSFELPSPWKDKRFTTSTIGSLNFLVGPNGSGKSRFAYELSRNLPSCRLLGTDRLTGMGQNTGLGIWGDNLASGIQKGFFSRLKDAGTTHGFGIDSYITLVEKPEIRIIIEATLTSLFGIDISLEWDSGNLIPMALSKRSSEKYRLDREECHGIRELIVLLTQLHNDEYSYLVIDEPELNLHPQYQSFFVKEARRIAGDPRSDSRKKGLFFITHSPYILDFRNVDDLQSVFSFSRDFGLPKHISISDAATRKTFTGLIPRLNVHHKQLFFSDNPIFVEGILDAQIVEAIQERREVSISGAGSCIIDAGGCEEVNKYVELCRHLNKSAYFLFDLDSLFHGNLRQCVKTDECVSDFLADLGVGTDFGKYCGELDRVLTNLVNDVRKYKGNSSEVLELKSYIEGLVVNGELKDKNLAKCRIAVITDIASRKSFLTTELSKTSINDAEGRLKKIIEILKDKNIFVLPGGALEHYLPSYSGNRYVLSEETKRNAVRDELELLANGDADSILATRYGELYKYISALPATHMVDIELVLRRYLADYIHTIQTQVIRNPDWQIEEMNQSFTNTSAGFDRLFSVSEFERKGHSEFQATIIVKNTDKFVRISHSTIAGMQNFDLQNIQPKQK